MGNVPNALKDLAFSGNTEIATWLLLTAYDEMHKERKKLKSELLNIEKPRLLALKIK